MSPTCRQTKRDKQKHYFRTYSRRKLFDLPQTLHGDIGRRSIPSKRSQSFFDPTHSFPTEVKMLIFGH